MTQIDLRTSRPCTCRIRFLSAARTIGSHEILHRGVVRTETAVGLGGLRDKKHNRLHRVALTRAKFYTILNPLNPNPESITTTSDEFRHGPETFETARRSSNSLLIQTNIQREQYQARRILQSLQRKFVGSEDRSGELRPKVFRRLT